MPATNDKLLVVGAGLPRTGTMTMKAALQRLLGEKCYHMDEFVKNGCEADAEHWRRALRGEATDKDWRDFFGGKDYRACVDYPASFFYKDIAAAFPNAKVVLTVREPEKWGESVRNAIYEGMTGARRFPDRLAIAAAGIASRFGFAYDLGFAQPRGFKHSMFTAANGGDETSREFFNAWVKQVKETIPAERLLVFQVKEGWAPLCKFLDVDVPDEPFPRVNDVAEMKANFVLVSRVGWAIALGVPTIIAGVAAAAYSYPT